MKKATKLYLKSLAQESIPYVLSSAAILTFAFFGSSAKRAKSNTNVVVFSENTTVSVDQLTNYYLSAALSESMNLYSKSILNDNYISVATQYASGQTSLDKIEKPTIVNTSSLTRGIISYTVQAGDTMESIAAAYGLTTDQIRWSNSLKTTSISEGDTLLLPSVSGIVYTVKDGDTVASIVSKYGGTEEEIITYNDLETQDLYTGLKIIIPDGTLPTTERPEYVAPRKTYTYSYSYSARYGGGNPYSYGWCTWYAWQWRHDNLGDDYTLPSSSAGNATSWDNNLAAYYYVDYTPAYGDVFVQDYSSGRYAAYGHVGIVTSVNADGSITISEMNGTAGFGRVGTRTITNWSGWHFIHGKR